MTVSLDYQTGAAVGDTLQVQVEVTNADEACAVQFALGFNEAALDCVSISTGPALTGMMSATESRRLGRRAAGGGKRHRN